MTKINRINLKINNDISYEGIFSELKYSVFGLIPLFMAFCQGSPETAPNLLEVSTLHYIALEECKHFVLPS